MDIISYLLGYMDGYRKKHDKGITHPHVPSRFEDFLDRHKAIDVLLLSAISIAVGLSPLIITYVILCLADI